MFCNRCGKIIPPSMPVINGNCPDWVCIKAPKAVPVKQKTVSKPVKVILEIPKVISMPVVAVITNRRHKVIKVRDIKFEMASKFVRPWK